MNIDDRLRELRFLRQDLETERKNCQNIQKLLDLSASKVDTLEQTLYSLEQILRGVVTWT